MDKVSFRNKNNKILNLSPTRLIIFSFALLILIGTLLLSLPAATTEGTSVGFLNAFFTSTSASCITGLVVIDTATHWSIFGQIVILCLIQVGALGIVTFTTFFSALLGRKVGLKRMILAQESINYLTFEGVTKMIRNVVIITFIFEAIGAILLSIRFIPKFGLKGLYMGVFHSVSAFCNSGFDIMGVESKSLTEFNNDPLVLFTISALIIVGGLGFLVWKDLYEYRRNKSLYLHTKVVLTFTAILLVFGFVFFLSFEYNNPLTMGKLSLFEKVNSAIFHSVSIRTSGFNSLPVGDMNEISKAATIIFMFIGAAPGSTGGGVKVTTLGVLIAAIICQIKGRNETIMFRRRVSPQIVYKSLSIAGLSAIIVIIMTTVIMAIEHKTFLDVFFEVTSAFSTTGLSTGITPELHSASKIFLILTMFLGRVGPVSFAIALTLRANKNVELIYPEGKIIVG